LLKLSPGLLIAIGFIIENIFLDYFFYHFLLILLCLFGHVILNLSHLFNDFFFGVFFIPLNRIIELDGGFFDSQLFLTFLLFIGTHIKWLTVGVWIIWVIFGLFLIVFVIIIEIILILYFRDHIENLLVLQYL